MKHLPFLRPLRGEVSLHIDATPALVWALVAT